MRTVASDDHRSHHSTELDRGRLGPSWERPERADLILEAIASARLGPIVPPAPLDRDLLARVHDAEYLTFLESAWDRWATEYDAPAAMGIAWPSRRLGRQRPEDLVGQLGYHSFAADCSIVSGTWMAATSIAGRIIVARLPGPPLMCTATGSYPPVVMGPHDTATGSSSTDRVAVHTSSSPPAESTRPSSGRST